ncbi:MAG TPA: vWA domain-containing protein [Polyangiaceae bacterium]|nr:vWA domain-containing protein [Polyangiaceae bacterium]
MKSALALAASLAWCGCSAKDENATTALRVREPAVGRSDTGSAAGNRAGPPSFESPGTEQFTSPDEAAASGSEANCGLQTFAVARRPADMLLVLDRSGSMQESPDEDDDDDDDSGTSKWDLTVPALNQVIRETDASVSWGMKLFPEGQDNDECSAATLSDTIHVPIAAANGNAVIGAIAATTPEGDGTPTGDALHAAITYLSALATPERKYIVLATDGEPSCSPSGEGQDDARPYAVDAVRQAFAAGFPVFVVGVATTKDSATEALDDMAVAGGAPRSDPGGERYYLANTQSELVSALRAITGEVASCVFPLTTPPPVPNNIGVKLDGTLLLRDPSRQDGWEYTSDALSEVEVHGPACERIQSAASSDVQVIYACEGVIIR